MTTDSVKAFEFYRARFNWEKTREMDMGGSMYRMSGNTAPYGGMYNRPVEMSGRSPFWLVYIHVKDVAKAVATATKAGARVHQPQMDIPGGSIAVLGDPQGAGFALHHASRSAAAAEKAAEKSVATGVVKRHRRKQPREGRLRKQRT